jgi:serine/threonine protein kinase
MPLSTGARLGPCEILAAIGAGGMGEAYKACDTRLGRDVAIKVLPAGATSAPERRRRFELKARAASALSHPHNCLSHNIGCETPVSNARFGLAATTAQCRSWSWSSWPARRSRILRQGSVPLDDVLNLGAQVADTLTTAPSPPDRPSGSQAGQHHAHELWRDVVGRRPGQVARAAGRDGRRCYRG